MLELTPIEIPAFDPIVIPELPPGFEVPETPALVAAYATVIQDFIDGQISNFDAYYAPVEVVRGELSIARDAVFRKYHKTRRKLLQDAGVRNFSLMPGYLMRQLTELAVEEKRDISEAGVKLVQDRATVCLQTLEWAVKAGFDSASLRADTSQTISELNLEIANDALKAGLAVTLQNVERANNIIKLTGLLIEEETVQKRIADIATIKLIADQQIDKINLDIMLYQIQGQGLMAQLEVLAARLVAAENEILVLNAEIDKAMAEWQVAIAQEAMAAMKIITAQYERQKSDARMAAAELEDAKMDVRLAKVEAEEGRVEALERVELAELALDVAAKNLELIRDEMEVARKNAEVALTEIKTSVLGIEAATFDERTRNIYTYIATRQRHTADAISAIAAQSAMATANIDQQIGNTRTETALLLTNVQQSIGSIGDLSTQSSNNVSSQIKYMAYETSAASRVIDNEIYYLANLTNLGRQKIDTAISQMAQESNAAKQVVAQRVVNMAQESSAASRIVADDIRSGDLQIQMAAHNAEIQASTYVSNASKVAGDLVREATTKSMSMQVDILAKQAETEAQIETSFQQFLSKAEQIGAAKNAAIVSAAQNAANANLTSKHIYQKG